MVNCGLIVAYAGIVLGLIYNIRSANMVLVYLELALFPILTLLVLLLRKKRSYFDNVTTVMVTVTLVFFDLLIVFSRPEDLKFVWLFIYSTLFIFIKGNKIGLAGFAIMLLSLVLLKIQPFIPVYYSTSQIIYIIFVVTILCSIVITFQHVVETSQKLIVKQKQQLAKVSVTDRLTGIYNRAKLDDILENEIHRYKRYKHVLGLILLDIDHFKDVNDTYGHQVGDKVLAELAVILKTHCRETDYVGRWGGEEFLFICPETDLDGIFILSETIRYSVESHKFSVIDKLTVSLGISGSEENDTADALLKRADDALYYAKGYGRNQTIVFADSSSL